MKAFISVNPFTGEELASYNYITDIDLSLSMETARSAQRAWRSISFEERAKNLLSLSGLIRNHADRLAALATKEMGKLFTEARAEVLKCSTVCEYYAAHAGSILGPVVSSAGNGREVTLRYEPLGVVLGVFPWNFPYWQILRSAVPVLAAGNAMLVKPAPSVPQCALALQELMYEAGFPRGIYQTVFASEDQIQQMIADPRISACTLTGSEKAGSAVASAAARYIKHTVLELGGSDPFIVLEDANVDLAVTKAIGARFQNNGQSCIAAKRFILHEGIAGQFISKLLPKVQLLRMGDPLDEATQVGPLARKDLRDHLAVQVEKSIQAGAMKLVEARMPEGPGYFYPPTVLANVLPGSPAYSEELFGPVMSVFTVKSDDEAISLANDTGFGLGATIWTADPLRAERIASALEAGQVFINEILRSNAAYPFGGVKRSGFGRELGEAGLREFCSLKTISAGYNG